MRLLQFLQKIERTSKLANCRYWQKGHTTVFCTGARGAVPTGLVLKGTGGAGRVAEATLLPDASGAFPQLERGRAVAEGGFNTILLPPGHLNIGI